MSRLVRLLCFALALAAGDAARTLWAQGYSPLDAPGRMTVADGLQVELVAAEPLVRQPVAIEFDDRGRLWVVQYLQYPNPAGLKRAKVDRYSRTTYDRMPEPPPRGPQGADRITILEDTDGDGRADRAKDFVSGLNLASGLAFGHGGVFVLQVPFLLFYADRNGDDVPDGDPDVLLTGFGMEDAHSVANSLTWGPDGWLYGCQGSTVTSRIRGIEFQQGVWRYHPLSHAFELFCEGGGNSWGLDFDEHGNLFYSTNFGGYAMLHGVQGAYYWKQFGKHGALHNPYAYGYFEHVPHHNLHGGHVTVGGVIYQGSHLPAAFRGKYIAADLLGHAAYWHALTPRGSTFEAEHAGDLLLANDSWFAPSDLTVGPDGAIYLCDWHDARTAHPDPDADWDRANGRIYRVSARAAAKSPHTPRLVALPSEKLLELLDDKNEWLVRAARRVLANRRDVEMILPLRRMVRDARAEQQAHLAIESLWALYVVGGLSDEFAAELLSHPHADVRWWTVRLVGDERRVAAPLAVALAQLARSEPSPAVRSQLAASAKRLPAGQALPIVEGLLANSPDTRDSYLPLLLWWAIEQHAVTAREEVLSLISRGDIRDLPVVRSTILNRLVRRYAAEATEPGYLACARLLAAAPDAERSAHWEALDLGLLDQAARPGGTAGTLFAGLADVTAAAGAAVGSNAAPATTPIPAELTDQLKKFWNGQTRDLALVRLGVRLGWNDARRRAAAIASDQAAPDTQRVTAISLLGEIGEPWCTAPLLKLLDIPQTPAVSDAALAALQSCRDPQLGGQLLARYTKFDARRRAKVCDALLARKASAHELLSAVDRGQIQPQDITLDQLRLVALHADKQLDALVKKHWGSVQGGSSEERLAEMRRINNDLRAGQGDARAGKALFARHCGTCHKLFGEGNPIGPELTHANRKNIDELLATIVNPSTVIRKEYLSFLLQASDGRVLTGLLVEQTPSRVTLLSAKNERTTVSRDMIQSLEESTTSLMPDNLLSGLKPQELRDLFRYLQSEPPATATNP